MPCGRPTIAMNISSFYLSSWIPRLEYNLVLYRGLVCNFWSDNTLYDELENLKVLCAKDDAPNIYIYSRV